MEIQPLCRYHFKNPTSPENNFLILDLLPDEKSTFNHYCLQLVGYNFSTEETWISTWIQLLKEEAFFGAFSEIKERLQTLIAEAFQYQFKCEVSYLPAYFK